MDQSRAIRKVFKSRPTLEGAGVHLKRAFGFSQAPLFDPFLLLDDFRGDHPDDYLAGFPWHPHRGIETITYILNGEVEHGDSLGNRGVIGVGDVQWMTAGSGIIHQEMPRGDARGKMGGFQLWANLPRIQKMTSPRYRELKREQIPVVHYGPASIRIISGEVKGTRGPVGEIFIDPEYLDIDLPPGSELTHPTRPNHTVFAYVIDGSGVFAETNPFHPPEYEGVNYFDMFAEPLARNGTLILFAPGEQIRVSTTDEGVRFLLVSGKPLGEPVAWAGPIVMNTQEELDIAFSEYRAGTFIKHS